MVSNDAGGRGGESSGRWQPPFAFDTIHKLSLSVIRADVHKMSMKLEFYFREHWVPKDTSRLRKYI